MSAIVASLRSILRSRATAPRSTRAPCSKRQARSPKVVGHLIDQAAPDINSHPRVLAICIRDDREEIWPIKGNVAKIEMTVPNPHSPKVEHSGQTPSIIRRDVERVKW